MRSGSIQARIVAKTGLTNIREVYFPEVGRMGMLIVSAKIRDKDDPRRIMDGIWNDSGEPGAGSSSSTKIATFAIGTR